MGRQKHCVHNYFFKHVNVARVVKVQWSFCQWVNRKNMTRIIQHLKDFCKIAPVKVKREMVTAKIWFIISLVTETFLELMDGHDEKIADNKIGEVNDKIPNARNHNYESTTVKRKVNDPVDKCIYREIPEERQLILARVQICG